MYYVNRLARRLLLLTMCLALTACNELLDDLNPSSEDKRGEVVAGSVGYLPSQVVADFTIKDSLNNDFILSDHLAGGAAPADIIVLYFTMWCPICLSHSDHMFNYVIPTFSGRGTVVYGLVDYVSGSVAATRDAEVANGYAGSAFTTLADVDQSLLNQLNGAMGIVVVIDSNGTVLMNEDYRNGADLIALLDQQLP